MKKNKNINIKFENNNLILIIENNQYTFSLLKISKRLLMADEKARNNFSISPSGYGIHWHDLDEDLSIQALINSSIKKPSISRQKKKAESN